MLWRSKDLSLSVRAQVLLECADHIAVKAFSSNVTTVHNKHTFTFAFLLGLAHDPESKAVASRALNMRYQTTPHEIEELLKTQLT